MLYWMTLPQARRNEIFSLECPDNNQGLSNVFEVEGSLFRSKGDCVENLLDSTKGDLLASGRKLSKKLFPLIG